MPQSGAEFGAVVVEAGVEALEDFDGMPKRPKQGEC